ncbi:Zn-dependent hydrolase [Halalkalibacterium halodurans]|uniref:N-carbamyl-L-amino acid amidohydrolase n=1 Tax=Halalkalibacterium halodurans (strain ATCC BAA-125 / DSM 18197 / FERM 7344 / JCM 9153 / C-125) TaxID=272558 RepID=Q9KET8_HALH5|nr:Zn-dependent hydrolase [Halalkalibacterium halodurans]MED4080387.1 Zn-dependent hydrolase [Halalkalibacterium halodurans]MED4084549.1 Zn-dependent hydrolase [Halalkalibacterium halodurans]MED4104887.1 Zn-dependent hydrolase [Halalkalibacterium halodurans]MED4109672.1 Zn-dependent hydrolase [Halalkalibacterium halodurans]MED4122908.1 Zn-dependent hydrolase [Halalkalibacterium halodurans]
MILTMDINQKRLWRTLMELAEIGGTSPIDVHGVTRLSLTKTELRARQYVIDLMKDSGLSVQVDAVGNIIGKLEGTDLELPSVMTGSHIDSVPHGGRFDGTLGVLGAIEAVRTMKEAGIKLKHSIEIVSFTDEEGARFGAGFIGSKGMAGELTETTFSLADDKGVTYREAFLAANLNPTLYKQAIRSDEQIKAYIEMHIEQGKVLEEHDLSIGIVTDIQGPVWLDVTLEGAADHAGATPMDMRKDAGLAMAEVLLAVEAISKEHQGVGTVGKMSIEPGGVNIIPGRACFSVDLRHIRKERRQHMVDDLHEQVEAICNQRGVTYNIDVKKEVEPATCSHEMVGLIDEVCTELNIRAMKMPCGAGHDALIMSKLAPIGMIFIRSKQGISHSPKEWSDAEDCKKGTQVLLHTLMKLAQ